jgi:hypothetical protein
LPERVCQVKVRCVEKCNLCAGHCLKVQLTRALQILHPLASALIGDCMPAIGSYFRLLSRETMNTDSSKGVQDFGISGRSTAYHYPGFPISSGKTEAHAMSLQKLDCSSITTCSLHAARAAYMFDPSNAVSLRIPHGRQKNKTVQLMCTARRQSAW